MNIINLYSNTNEINSKISIEKLDLIKTHIKKLSDEQIVCFIDTPHFILNSSTQNLEEEFSKLNCDLFYSANENLDHDLDASNINLINCFGFIGYVWVIKKLLIHSEINEIKIKKDSNEFFFHLINNKPLSLYDLRNGQIFIKNVKPCLLLFNNNSYENQFGINIIPYINKEISKKNSLNLDIFSGIYTANPLKNKELDKIRCFVFCSSKTGSTTIKKSFLNKFGKSSTIQLHQDLIPQISQHQNENFIFNKKIKDIIVENSKRFDKIYIIDSYREPFERAISGFFQKIDKRCPDWQVKSIDELIDHFNVNNYIFLKNYHSYYESWGYFNVSTDINFDFEKGYVVRQHENIILVKTRLKDSYRWEKIFSEIINDKIMIISDNDSKEKIYSEKYLEFKKKYVLPNEIKKEFLNIINDESDKNNPFYITWKEMKKFMTKNEIEEYLKKWIL